MSVIQQDYPDIEYLIIDGGSSDGSVQIIEKYSQHFAWWVSEPDSGQADAINKGFRRASGEIVAWLNSDDLYLPHAVSSAIEIFQSNPNLGMVFGDAITIDQSGRLLNTLSFSDWDLLDLLSFRIICQPAVFLRREILNLVSQAQTNYLQPDLHYMLDHALWLRMASLAPIKHIRSYLAAARHHPDAKNVAQAPGFGRETMQLLNQILSDPDFASQVKGHQRKIKGGAYRLNARYLLDGGLSSQAIAWYTRAILYDPGYTLQHWHRMLYALVKTVGLSKLADNLLHRHQLQVRSRLPDVTRLVGSVTWPGIT